MFEDSGAKKMLLIIVSALIGAGIGGILVSVHYESTSRECCYDRLSKEAKKLEDNVDRFKEFDKKIKEALPERRVGYFESLSKMMSDHQQQLQSYRRDMTQWGFNLKENCPPGKAALPAPGTFVVEVFINISVAPPAPANIFP